MAELFLGENITITDQEDGTTIFQAPNTTIKNLVSLEVENIEISKSLDMKENKIKNVSSGTELKDAVNLQQLESLQDKLTENIINLEIQFTGKITDIDKKIEDIKKEYENDSLSTKEIIIKNKEEVDKNNEKILNDIATLSLTVSELSEKLNDISMFFFKGKNPKINKK